MRKHILSNYSEKKDISIREVVSEFYQGKTTYETGTIENTDTDEFVVKDSTVLTETIENTDTDGFVNLSTEETRSI